MLRFILTCLSLSYTLTSTANKDSLWTIWNDVSIADTIRLLACYDLINSHYMYEDLDSALMDFPALPERRERMLPTTDIREGMLDVWDFQQCGMMNLIADRNSTLGKVRLPSQKMIYELRFMASLQPCRDKMTAVKKPTQREQKFIQRLNAIYRITQQSQPS